MMANSVLVVESHADLRTVIVEVLTRADYRCEAVANGSDGLRKLREQEYELIVIDTDSLTPMSALCAAVSADPAWRDKLILIGDENDPRSLQKPFDRRQLLAWLQH
jgi:CheY-like chemotaxis protein